ARWWARYNGRAAKRTAWLVVWEDVMAYTDFTLDMLIDQFGLQIQEDSAFLDGFMPVPISPLLRQELEENVPLARDISTEKARSERSEEHTSELQSRGHLVCRLLLEKKKNNHV